MLSDVRYCDDKRRSILPPRTAIESLELVRSEYSKDECHYLDLLFWWPCSLLLFIAAIGKFAILSNLSVTMMDATLINVPPSFKVSREQFEQLAGVNRDVRLELTSSGELIIMPPTGGNTGKRNIDIEGQLWFWNRQTDLGVVFDSSTGFCLPNGAYRSPDAAWISKEKWDNLTREQQDTFPPLCPDFIIELRSSSDTMKSLQEKMLEYIDNGATLGWLIDPMNKKVEIYRGDRSSVEVLDNPKTVAGVGVVSGFVLDLSVVFS